MEKVSSAISILIVEDNEAEIHLIKETISGIRIPNDISWARRGEEALQFVRENRPDLVILDTLLPDKSGFEVLEEIKNDDDFKGISVVMTSGSGDLRYVREHAPLADGYIEKPITLEILAEGVSHTDHFAVAIVRI